MEILSRLFATLIAVSVVLGWVYGISFLVDAPLTFQSAAMAFVIAPLLEEFFFRWVPYELGKHTPHPDRYGLVFLVIFIWWHVDNYPYFGWYYATLVQGVLGWFLWQLQKRYGLFYAILAHCTYNLATAAIY